jgi:transcriptional regulatory protein RtcR
MKKTVVIGLLGPTLDSGIKDSRWQRWRPTVAVCGQEDLLVHRLELLHEPRFEALAQVITGDIAQVSPETRVVGHAIAWNDPWDFEEVFAALHEFARGYRFKPDDEDYLVHITTGTHVAQICLFLLTESHHFPARLIQTSPGPGRSLPGTYSVIDLDLSRYDRLASRFQEERAQSQSFLKSGIDTRNRAFNQLIERIEQVTIASDAPMLLMGPTGAGKSQLARRVYELRCARRQLAGPFVAVNCATLRGDAAMSALFGHVKGAFTGAQRDRPGLLRSAHTGMMFLDEIGELGLDEQAMLLRAVEEKTFLPVGSDREQTSDFQLIAGTNRDLGHAVAQGRFREDLLARINLWTFRLPGLRERPEDMEPNLDYELAEWTRRTGRRITFNREARAAFLRFATSPGAVWAGNFRDFNAAIVRMATLATSGRINVDLVNEEIERLRASWQALAGGPARPPGHARVRAVLGHERAARLDRFDRVLLADVLEVCAQSRSLSEAGRALFSESRKLKTQPNDADRLRKYLARFDLSWDQVVATDLDSA